MPRLLRRVRPDPDADPSSASKPQPGSGHHRGGPRDDTLQQQTRALAQRISGLNLEQLRDLSAHPDLLTPDERLVLGARLGWPGAPPRARHQLAARLGQTRTQIQQLETSALRKLRLAGLALDPPDAPGASWLYALHHDQGLWLVTAGGDLLASGPPGPPRFQHALIDAVLRTLRHGGVQRIELCALDARGVPDLRARLDTDPAASLAALPAWPEQ